MTPQQAFALAVQHHQAGQLAQAETLCRQILAQQPNHADALHLLGFIAHQVGKNDLAIDLIQRAIALQPANPEACNNLGIALRAHGQLDAAIAAFRQAIALKPNHPDAHNNLGVTLRDQGQLDAALAAFRQAIALQPTHPGAHYNLGITLKQQGQLDAAISAYRQAIALQPNYAEAHGNLGVALREQGQIDAALAAFHQALALQPNRPNAHVNLGVALRDKGQIDDALAAFRQAIALQPNYSDAHYNLGLTLMDKRQTQDAIAALRQAIALNPNFPDAHASLGIALRDHGQIDEAITAFRQAILLNPNHPAAYSNLGVALNDVAQLDEALAAYRHALALDPHFSDAHSNLVCTMNYHPGYDAHAIAEELRRWNRQHAEPLHHLIQPLSNDRNPDRPLRIGYVSSDFYAHACTTFSCPSWNIMIRAQVELFCYAQIPLPDAITRRLQKCTPHWHSTVNLSDDQVANQIREDRIDILVDLKLHTDRSRLLIFARKPAPVQVTWLGYPGSTGLTTIDYRLTDPYLDPPGMDESNHSERTLRLPDTFWCYDPLDERDLPINPLPALANGFITFGCLNNFCKINAPLLALWSRVLCAVKDSRMLILSHEGAHRQRTLDAFATSSVTPNRIKWLPRAPRPNYLTGYHRIDIGLDTLPYNGHTTSLDSFWMGVPVLTLIGKTIVGRAGLSQLTNLALPQLAASTPEEFITLATTLAADLPQLQLLRSTLRQSMQQSPLMDAPRFARAMEAAYRAIWQKWCLP